MRASNIVCRIKAVIIFRLVPYVKKWTLFSSIFIENVLYIVNCYFQGRVLCCLCINFFFAFLIFLLFLLSLKNIICSIHVCAKWYSCNLNRCDVGVKDSGILGFFRLSYSILKKSRLVKGFVILLSRGCDGHILGTIGKLVDVSTFWRPNTSLYVFTQYVNVYPNIGIFFYPDSAKHIEISTLVSYCSFVNVAVKFSVTRQCLLMFM
jgi:hypothetical protein